MPRTASADTDDSSHARTPFRLELAGTVLRRNASLATVPEEIHFQRDDLPWRELYGEDAVSRLDRLLAPFREVRPAHRCRRAPRSAARRPRSPPRRSRASGCSRPRSPLSSARSARFPAGRPAPGNVLPGVPAAFAQPEHQRRHRELVREIQDARFLPRPGMGDDGILEHVRSRALGSGGGQRPSAVSLAGQEVGTREPPDAAQQGQGDDRVAVLVQDDLVVRQSAVGHGQPAFARNRRSRSSSEGWWTAAPPSPRTRRSRAA